MAATSRAFLFWPSHVVNLEVMVRICRLELPALESSLRADDEELHLKRTKSIGVRMAEVAISTPTRSRTTARPTRCCGTTRSRCPSSTAT